MAASRHPPASPGARDPSAAGPAGGRGTPPVRRTKLGAAVPRPGAVPPRLPGSPPPIPAAAGGPPAASPQALAAFARRDDGYQQGEPNDPNDSFDEQTIVDPQAPKILRDQQLADLDIDRRSTTATEVAEDSAEILLEPSGVGDARAVDDRIAAGTGETGGSVDELTRDEGEPHVPQLAVVRGAPRLPPGGHQGGSRFPSSPPGDDAPLSPTGVPRNSLQSDHRMAAGAGSPTGVPRNSLQSDHRMAAGAGSPAWLVVQAGTDRGRRFALKTGRSSIGRGVENDVVLTDIAVSRKHLVIDFDGAGYVMSDLGSGNGTVINDHDEDGAYRLGHGDKLELGNTVLVFECTTLVAQPPALQPLGKWPSSRDLDDDEMSTVAGKKPVRSSTPSSQPPPMRASNGTSSGATVRHIVGPGPGASQPGPPLRPPAASSGPMPILTGGGGHGTVPPPVGDPSSPLMVHGMRPMPGPPMSRDPNQLMSSPFPTAPAHMPTLSSEAVIGMGGPGPAPLPQVAYPSAQLFGQSHVGGHTTSPSSPRFQFANGVMAPAPAPERRRLLIGILGIAFVAVGAGIVMALVYGGDDPAETAAPRQGSAVKAPAGTAPTADTAAATASPPVALHELYGDHELLPAAFGTDEQFLSGATTAAVPPSTGTVQTDAAGSTPPDPGAVPPATVGAADDQKEADAERARVAREERIAARRERALRNRESSETDDEADDETDTGDDETSDDEGGGSARDAETALRQAEVLYRSKKFGEAASKLRDAADSAPKKSAGPLRTLAGHYARIGTLMADGQESVTSDAPKALQSFKAALRLDEEFGDSAHDKLIGARIALVAPSAAGAYMARKKFPEAKAAADIAETFSSGDSDKVRIVRQSLERKAEEIYEEASQLAEEGDTDAAAERAKLILRMVQKSSDIYAKAQKLTSR